MCAARDSGDGKDDMTAWIKAACVAGVLVVASGCGGGGSSFADGSFKEITDATSGDMKDLKSLHMSGSLTTGDSKIGIDVSATTDGACRGTISQDDGHAEVLSTGHESWMRPDDAFWEKSVPDQAAVIEQAVGDKWVVVPAGADFDSFCDLDSLLGSFDDKKDPSDGPTKKEGVESVGGVDAVKLSGKSDGQAVAAWVAVDDPHYILKFELGEGGDTSGTLTFSEFDDSVDVKAPASSDVFDLGSLG
jgi:hypothetical protein